MSFWIAPACLPSLHRSPHVAACVPAAALAGPSSGPQSEFARRAGKIGMGIHSTSQKLQKLAQLARRTSMFDDPAEEINELSTVVKQDIQVAACGRPAGGGGPAGLWGRLGAAPGQGGGSWEGCGCAC